MIAHVGIIVSDIERSKKFYTAALKPIGYQMIREYGVTPTRPAAERRLRRTAARRSVDLPGRSRPRHDTHCISSEPTRLGRCLLRRGDGGRRQRQWSAGTPAAVQR